jgi:lipopolysaccharide biosynthesis glycosyltransferase
MLELPDVTIWTIVWNNDRKWIGKAGEVLRYCERIIICPRLVLFTSQTVAAREYPFDVIKIPQLDWKTYNIFINRVVQNHISTKFAMSVHEDGFPIDLSQWDPQFLEYDYIGAPWSDSVVGNGGFNIESRKLMDLKTQMPFTEEDLTLPSDRLVCSARREWLEKQGVRFAPVPLAMRFSTEQIGGGNPSFGFHGRLVSAPKYRQGWQMITAMSVKMSNDRFYKVGNKIVQPPRAVPVVPVQSGTSTPACYPKREGMKICIATVFDRNYMMAGRTMMKTVRQHTDCTGIDFRIITADPEVVKAMGAENCHFVNDEIQQRYKGVKYSPELPKEKYHTSWYRYEIFSFEGYDRVICIDSDCICIEDISYLFSADLDPYDLISVEDHIVTKCFTKYVPQLEAQGLRFRGLKSRLKNRQIDIQPALLVANKSIVNMGWYRKLLLFANRSQFTYSIDEGILNDFIYDERLKIKILPLEWDYQDLYEMHCPMLPVPEKPIIVHCQESKPFVKAKSSLDPRMHKWHNRWWEEHNAK